MISLDDLPPNLYELAVKWFIDDSDIRDINRAIRGYDPVVYTVDEDPWECGYSVLVGDKNRRIPPMWIDYYMNMGEVESEWNIDYIDYSPKMGRERLIVSLYQYDEEVFDYADSIAFEYLADNGCIKYDKDKRCYKTVCKKARPVKSENNPKSPTKRKNTVQPKSSAKTKETTATKKRSGKK